MALPNIAQWVVEGGYVFEWPEEMQRNLWNAVRDFEEQMTRRLRKRERVKRKERYRWWKSKEIGAEVVQTCLEKPRRTCEQFVQNASCVEHST